MQQGSATRLCPGVCGVVDIRELAVPVAWNPIGHRTAPVAPFCPAAKCPGYGSRWLGLPGHRRCRTRTTRRQRTLTSMTPGATVAWRSPLAVRQSANSDCPGFHCSVTWGVPQYDSQLTRTTGTQRPSSIVYVAKCLPRERQPQRARTTPNRRERLGLLRPLETME